MELNRDDIIKALECCFINKDCNGCPMFGCGCDCLGVAGTKAVSLIKELTEEIKDLTETVEVRGKVVEKLQIAINEIEEDNRKLTEENERLHTSCTELEQKCASVKADTVRKMQERLKAQKFTHKNFGELVYVEDIDQIANELLEGKDET